MRTRRTTVVAALVVSAVLVSGCGVASRAQGSGATSSPGVAPNTGPAGPIPAGLEKYYRQTPDWSPCGGRSECATIEVPLDYDKPDGDTIELRARRVPARDQRNKIGTLFINPGGPGGSGVDYAGSAEYVLRSSLLRRFDVIGWDPRGVGQSTPVRCIDTQQMDQLIAADGSPDNETEINRLNTLTKEFADACDRRSGKLLPHVSTQDAARDIDVLRGIVGDEQLYYYGASYGTYLGATYAELFPRNAGRLVLDGAVDPALTAEQLSIGQAKGFDRALDAFAANCAQRACELGTTKAAVLAAVDKLIADTDVRPLPGDGDRQVTQGVAVLGVLYPLYVQQYWPRLENAVADGLRGNGSRLLALADEYTSRGSSGYEDNSGEVIYAVNCIDRPDITSVADAKSKAAEYMQASPRFGAYLLWGSLACANWPVKPVNQPHPIKAEGAKPIVVVGTTRDPATPYEWSVALAKELDSGVLITRDGDGHTGYNQNNECVDEAVETYLLDGTPPSADLKC